MSNYNNRKKIVISISGKAGSGKDTIAAMIKPHMNVSFAEPLKTIAKNSLNIPEIYFYDRELKETCFIIESSNLYSTGTTPRKYLQYLGSSMRKIIGPDVFVSPVKRKIINSQSDVEIITCSDTRFPNEIEMFKKLDPEKFFVLCIKVIRPDNQDATESSSHISENALDFYKFDHVIKNDTDLDGLKKTVDNFMYLVYNCIRYIR